MKITTDGPPEPGAPFQPQLSPAAVAVCKEMLRVLRDLQTVAGWCQMTVEAWHPRLKERRDAADLPALLDTAEGQAWLLGMRLRVRQTRAFPARWREMFGDVFDWVEFKAPENAAPPDASPAARAARSAANLREFLAANYLSQGDFAKALGVTQATVSRRLSGAAKWTPKWAAKVKACIDAHPEWDEEE
jgi:DNA-binding transcriptional regulator YiaG